MVIIDCMRPARNYYVGHVFIKKPRLDYKYYVRTYLCMIAQTLSLSHLLPKKHLDGFFRVFFFAGGMSSPISLAGAIFKVRVTLLLFEYPLKALLEWLACVHKNEEGKKLLLALNR